MKKICFSKICVSSFWDILDFSAFCIFIVVGAIIPDIDKKNSYIGKRLPCVSRFVSRRFGHRTFTHSIIFVFIVYTTLNYLSIDNSITFGITIGISSHILLDMFNFQGVSLLYPLNTKHKIGQIKTNSGFEKTFRIVLILAFVLISFC